MTCPILLLARWYVRRLDGEAVINCGTLGCWCPRRKEENENAQMGNSRLHLGGTKV
jgi:hypothetical protein